MDRRSIYPSTQRLAWVGDSFCYFNDLPKMVEEMLGSDGRIHERVLTGGAKLDDHVRDPRVGELLAKEWDAIIIQERSQIPGGYDLAKLGKARLAARDFFAKRARAPVKLFFGTWAHRRGSVVDASREAYPNYKTMQSKLSAGCKRISALLGAGTRYVPVGEAFREVYEACARQAPYPENDKATLFSRLYAPDGCHPSRLGSFLAASVFYAALTGLTPEAHPYRPPERCAHDDRVDAAFNCIEPGWRPMEMSDDDAAALQAAAARATVYLRAQVKRACGGLEDTLEDTLDSDDDADEEQLARELVEGYVSPTSSPARGRPASRPPPPPPPPSLLLSPSAIPGARQVLL